MLVAGGRFGLRVVRRHLDLEVLLKVVHGRLLLVFLVQVIGVLVVVEVEFFLP